MTRTFSTTSGRPLRHDSPPMILWHKAKKYGTWDPRDINFDQDKQDWLTLNELEKDVLFRLTTLFQAGEESVTLDLLPLILSIAREGRLEEEMFLTSFLWEEAKHVEGFQRFLHEVMGNTNDLCHYYTPSYDAIFGQALPNALNRLLHDHSPYAQAEASVTYNMIVEGMLAETGYFAYYNALQKANLFPGMIEFVGKLKRDESRHIAYGVFLLSRLVAEHGEPMWQTIQNKMEELLEPAMGVILEGLGNYEILPFGINMDEITEYAMSQFQKRMDRIERSKHQTLEEIYKIAAKEEPH